MMFLNHSGGVGGGGRSENYEGSDGSWGRVGRLGSGWCLLHITRGFSLRPRHRVFRTYLGPI